MLTTLENKESRSLPITKMSPSDVNIIKSVGSPELINGSGQSFPRPSLIDMLCHSPMNDGYDRTTELLKVLSLLNRLDGSSMQNPVHPERMFCGGEDSRLEIRQELVQLATPLPSSP
jgi:hypothetical protein